MDKPTVVKSDGKHEPGLTLEHAGGEAMEQADNADMIRLLDEADAVCRQLVEGLLRLRSIDSEVRTALEAGASIQQACMEIESARVPVRESLAEMSSALRRVRTEAIRSLVANEGLSVSEVSRVVGHPRQLVKRLYDASDKERPRTPSSPDHLQARSME
jgi:hypothetical protein